MPKVINKKANGVNVEGEVYLTKRLLVSIALKAGKEAAAETMSVMGYNVISENGWVIKIYADGKKEQIKKIDKVDRPTKIILY